MLLPQIIWLRMYMGSEDLKIGVRNLFKLVNHFRLDTVKSCLLIRDLIFS